MKILKKPKYWYTYSKIINLIIDYEKEIQEEKNNEVSSSIRIKIGKCKQFLAEVERELEGI